MVKAGKLFENFRYRRFQQKDDDNIVPDIILVIPNDFKRIHKWSVNALTGYEVPTGTRDSISAMHYAERRHMGVERISVEKTQRYISQSRYKTILF